LRRLNQPSRFQSSEWVWQVGSLAGGFGMDAMVKFLSLLTSPYDSMIPGPLISEMVSEMALEASEFASQQFESRDELSLNFST